MSTQTGIADRLRFMMIDDRAQAALREMAPLVTDALPGVLLQFYDHIRRWGQVSHLFANDAAMTHAAQKQVEHWSIILRGDFGPDYVASVRRIGLTHNRIGLEPRWYIAGYNFIVERVVRLLAKHAYTRKGVKDPAQREAEAERLIGAFTRAAMLDMDFAISIYLEAGEEDKKKAMHDIANKFESGVGDIVQTVASAATELEQTARTMAKIAEATTGKAIAVSAAAEEATSNVTLVASSTEEMGQSVAEIAGQVSHASRIASSAVVKARTTNETMSELSRAAEKIGEVVSLISDIAAQTNLLALNATIESARAGEAGRGFAVVAAEVKSLAGQTAKATEEIGAQISAMQAIAKQSVEAIVNIQTTINEIDSVSAAINAAVEEQTATTKEISRNTHEAATGTQDVTSNITEVQRDASETGVAATQVVDAATELGRQAEQLRAQVGDFLVSIRAA
ncbi:MAG: globin-coupled sensor protein [Hyphomonadaceae bacterium]